MYPIEIMEYIGRTLQKELKKSAKEYPVTAVLGPRQSGKTTLAVKAFPKKHYISLENMEAREFALKDPKNFLKTYSNGVILDEVGRCPSLLSYIQTKVDKDKQKGQYILTGSNQFLLEEKITQSLAGRVSILRLLPLSLEELQHSNKIKSANEMIFKGGYPQLHTEDIRVHQWFGNYLDTYVNKDIRLVKNITNLSQFNNLIKMCAARAGQILNLQSLSSDCGIAQNTVKSWLSVLENSFVIKLLYPYYKNFNKRLIKSPKIFFYDTGLLCYLLSIKKSSEINTHAFKGSLFENFVFVELEKYFFNLGEKPPLYFWRDKSGHEIDFLVDEEILKIIEVKAGQTIAWDFFKNIEYFYKISNCKVRSYLIYAGRDKQIRGETKVFSWKDMNQVLK